MSKKICMVLVFLLTMAGMLSAQTRTVKGNVVFSEDGQPAIGAYVSVEGTKIGGITDVDGNFQITGVPASAKFVVVTYLGAKEKKVAIADVMKITVDPDSEVLEGVVVTECRKWTSASLRDPRQRSTRQTRKSVVLPTSPAPLREEPLE